MLLARLIHLCNNVSLTAPQKFYFRKQAVVEILVTNFRGGGHFFIGTPSSELCAVKSHDCIFIMSADTTHLVILYLSEV